MNNFFAQVFRWDMCTCFCWFHSWEWKFGIRGVATFYFLQFLDFIIRETEVKDELAQDTD